jgi:hypothetical protein
MTVAGDGADHSILRNITRRWRMYRVRQAMKTKMKPKVQVSSEYVYPSKTAAARVWNLATLARDSAQDMG